MIIGLTGPMASGKNLAAKILEKAGCISVDAYVLAHEAIEKAKDKILLDFEKDAKEKNIAILNDDGSINRRELAKIVFSSKENLKKQESIVHPVVNEMMEDFIKKNSDKTVILNATVLYKTPIIKKCDAIIFITSPWILRFFRAKKRDKMKNMQIFKRFFAQFNIFAKYKNLDADIYKVRNFVSEQKLEQKLLYVLKKIYS